MAAKQPDKKNVDLFAVGTPRSLLLAEFGIQRRASHVTGKSMKYLNLSKVTVRARKLAAPYSTVRH